MILFEKNEVDVPGYVHYDAKGEDEKVDEARLKGGEWAENGPRMAEMGESGRKWAKWAKMGENGQKWAKMGKNRQK